ncbi:MAG: hypothetical protein GEU26_16170 [Nitrososphaeraceae archaeon]|jgi:hypothetical protein|nr:hypothetical protein [Nitrososphaeraceae archaeon]
MNIRNLLSLQPIPDTSVYKGTLIESKMPEILTYLKLWGNNTRGLWAFHIFLGIFATFFSLLAATGFGGDLLSRVFAFVAALSIAFLTAFNLGAKSNNTRNAWRLLNTAILRFNEGLLGKDEVINAYESGEAMIGGITFNQTKIQKGDTITPNLNKENKSNDHDESAV